MSANDFAPFYKKLRELGFKRWDDSGRGGNNYCVQYEKRYPADETKVNVQFWPNSTGQRVTNMHHYKIEGLDSPFPYGIGDSYPSEFSSVKGMIEAIEFERTRYLSGVDKHENRNFN